MAYSEINKVRGLLGSFELGAATLPTEAEATALIDLIGNEIDSALSAAGIAVPVTTPTYFKDALQLLNSVGAVAAILRVMFPDASGAAETPAYAFWAKWYSDGMKRLADGSGIPPGITTNAARVMPSSYLTEHPDEEEELGDIAEPRFKMGNVY